MEKQAPNSMEQIIVKQLYEDQSFNVGEDDRLRQLIDFINESNVPTEQEINNGKFILIPYIFDLIKFYSTPIIICFQSFYKKLQKCDAIVMKYTQQLKRIASLVKSLLGDTKLQQVNFFFFLGTLRKRFNMGIRADNQAEFLKYISQLSHKLNILRKKIPAAKNQKDKKIIEQINALMEDICQATLARKLHFIQENYDNYLKAKAHEIFKQISQSFTEDVPMNQPLELEQKQSQQIQISPNKLNVYQSQQIIPLCCRRFFFKQQIIPQPQSLTIQYKHYRFPYKMELMNTLKKTFCGFLNGDGGTIYVGIHQDVNSKERKVIGDFYDETTKQDVLRTFRVIAESISPDIVTHKLYNVNFVPIKNVSGPQDYISGKYVIKITIRYGARDDIYSYKNQSQIQCYAFRTQNEVIQRKGREVLIALKERVRNPLPLPPLLHQGQCPPPDVGRPIHNPQISIKQLHEQKSILYEDREVQREHYRRPYNRDNGRSYIPKMQIQSKNKTIYLITQYTEEVLKTTLQKNQMDLSKVSFSKNGLVLCMTVENQKPEIMNKYTKLCAKFNERKYRSCHIVSHTITIDLPIEEYNKMYKSLVLDTLKNINTKFNSVRANSFQFDSFNASINAFLALSEIGVRANFVPQENKT